MCRRDFCMFMFPSGMERNMHRMTSNVQYREDITFDAITDHQERIGCQVQMRDQFFIIAREFIGHDFNVMKIALEPRSNQFALLIQQITFGGHNQTIVLS